VFGTTVLLANILWGFNPSLANTVIDKKHYKYLPWMTKYSENPKYSKKHQESHFDS
jgi:hypothetical protein